MNREQALAKMISPGMKRPNRWGGVIQIWVTRQCDKSCFACTQGSNLAGPYDHITLENFEKACISLKGYFGTVGMFGGNPCIHPQFDKLCEIMRKHIPLEQRGLWSNNLIGKGVHARKTFNPIRCNLNVHMDAKAMAEFKKDWPEAKPFGMEDSRHSPVYVAMKDVLDDEAKRWELISTCDINQHWSAMIGQFRGEARAWFCEIAGSQSMLHQHEEDYPDTGLEVEPGWWKKTMTDFAHQVDKHCHDCGVPLRGYGELACSTDKKSREKVSATHEGVYTLKKTKRKKEVVVSLDQLNSQALKFTDYLGGAKK